MGLWSNPSGTGHVGKAVVATDAGSVDADQDNRRAAVPNQGGGRWQGRDEHRRVAKLAPRPERGAVPGTGRGPYGGAAPPAPPCADDRRTSFALRLRASSSTRASSATPPQTAGSLGPPNPT